MNPADRELLDLIASWPGGAVPASMVSTLGPRRIAKIERARLVERTDGGAVRLVSGKVRQTKPRATDADAQIGRRLRERRVTMGLSQTELASAVGVTFQQMQKYERGTNRVSASRLFALAGALGVPVGYFFGTMEGAAEAEPDIPLDRRDVLTLVRHFDQIADDRVRKAIVGVVAAARHSGSVTPT